jgi:PAS domain S-box-containing protein
MTPTESIEERGPSTAEIRALRLFDGLADQATFILGPQGHIENWSVGAEEVTGYSTEEAIGKHVSLLYAPDEIASGEPNHELARAEQLQQIQSEVRRIRRDGSRYTAHQVVTVMRARSGAVRGFVVVLRDLTERRRAADCAAPQRRALPPDGRERQGLRHLHARPHRPRAHLERGGGADQGMAGQRDHRPALLALLPRARGLERQV